MSDSLSAHRKSSADSTEIHMLLSKELDYLKVKHVREFKVYRDGLLHCSRCLNQWDSPFFTEVKGMECPKCHHNAGSTKFYQLDEYLPDRKVNLEVDGDIHHRRRQERKDSFRDEYLKSRGVKTVRLPNKLVSKYPHELAELIAAFA